MVNNSVPLSSFAAMAAPAVEHQFNGESRLLSATHNQRTEIKKALAALQQVLQRIEGHPVQVQADIRFNVSGPQAKEHLYTISVTDAQFDAKLFARTRISATPAFTDRQLNLAPPSPQENEERPQKRARTESQNGTSALSDIALFGRMNDMMTLMEAWRNDWKQQGGWLFDKLNTMDKAQKDSQPHLVAKLEEVQDVLGQSINSATATSMSEFSKIEKLIL